MRKEIVLVAALAVGGVGAVAGMELVHAMAGNGAAFADSARAARSLAGGLLLYAVMIAGVLGNHLYGYASEMFAKDQPLSINAWLKSVRGAPRLWMALAVSPFLFHGVHLMTGDVPERSSSFFFAFQNGFFWQAVFAGFQAKVTSAASAPEPEPAQAAAAH